MQNVLILAVCVVVYIVPSIVAFVRPLPKTDQWHIGLCNVFLGWTVIAWAVCLWWGIAYTGEHKGAPRPPDAC